MVLPPRSCNTWASCVDTVCVCASDRASLEITMPHRSIQTLGFEKVGEAQSTENYLVFSTLKAMILAPVLGNHPCYTVIHIGHHAMHREPHQKHDLLPGQVPLDAQRKPLPLWPHVAPRIFIFWGEGQRLNRIKHISDLSSWWLRLVREAWKSCFGVCSKRHLSQALGRVCNRHIGVVSQQQCYGLSSSEQ